jgi:hypothetical protein
MSGAGRINQLAASAQSPASSVLAMLRALSCDPDGSADWYGALRIEPYVRCKIAGADHRELRLDGIAPESADRLEHFLIVGNLDDVAVRVVQCADVAHRF